MRGDVWAYRIVYRYCASHPPNRLAPHVDGCFLLTPGVAVLLTSNSSGWSPRYRRRLYRAVFIGEDEDGRIRELPMLGAYCRSDGERRAHIRRIRARLFVAHVVREGGAVRARIERVWMRWEAGGV